MNHKLRTVIVEDNMVARMILENYCKNHPEIELLEDFDNVQEARNFLNHEKVDLVLLDIQLRDSSGFDLLKYLPANTQVIVTTGSSANIKEAEEHGLTNCLLKPITLEDFLVSIKKLDPLAHEII